MPVLVDHFQLGLETGIPASRFLYYGVLFEANIYST